MNLLKYSDKLKLVSRRNVRVYTRNDTKIELVPINMSFTSYPSTVTSAAKDKIPPLLIMHGLFGSKKNWNSLCKVFNEKTQPERYVIAVDARNHGDSPHTSQHTYAHLAEDIKALLTNLNINKASILGHSMGGRAAMYFALNYADLVDKLIVADVSPVSTSPDLMSMSSIITAVHNVKLPNNVSMVSARAMCDAELSKDIKDKKLRAFLLTNLIERSSGIFDWRVNVEALKSCFFDHIARFPDVGDLQFNGQVLFVAGAKSDFIRKSDHPRILKIFPNAVFHEIPGAGHWVHSDKPHEFLKVCLEFLNVDSIK